MTEPKNLDGHWSDDGASTASDSYREFRSGPVVVRYNDDFEPDGELVTDGPIDSVHIERMDDDHVWLAIYYGGPGSLSRVAVELYSEGGKRRKADPIKLYWRDER